MAQPKGTAAQEATNEETLAAAAKRPVLDLSSVVKDAVPVEDEAYLTIDGNRYPYAQIGALSLRERRQYTARMERIMALETKEEPLEEDEAEYRNLLTAMARQLVPELPEDVAGRLDDGQLADIALAFFAWAAEHHPRMAVVGQLGVMGDRLRKMSIGARSSPASSVSTEATRNGG